MPDIAMQASATQGAQRLPTSEPSCHMHTCRTPLARLCSLPRRLALFVCLPFAIPRVHFRLGMHIAIAGIGTVRRRVLAVRGGGSFVLRLTLACIACCLRSLLEPMQLRGAPRWHISAAQTLCNACLNAPHSCRRQHIGAACGYQSIEDAGSSCQRICPARSAETTARHVCDRYQQLLLGLAADRLSSILCAQPAQAVLCSQ